MEKKKKKKQNVRKLCVEYQKGFPNPPTTIVIDDPPKFKVAEWIYFTLTVPTMSILAQTFYFVLMVTILASTVLFIMESEEHYLEYPKGCEWVQNYTLVAAAKVEDVSACQPQPKAFFGLWESIFVGLFTFEYILRFATVGFCRNWKPDEKVPEKLPFCKLFLKFVSDGFNLVDFLSILPFWVSIIFDSNVMDGLNLTRVLRLIRIFRVFKLSKHSEMATLVFRVLMKSHQALFMMGFVTLLSMVVFGSLIFFAEQQKWAPPSPEYPTGVHLRYGMDGSLEPTPFVSISSAFWWSLVTCTTVGYGDHYPTSVLGKILGSFAMLTGILLLALPITIIGTNFNAEYGVAKMNQALDGHTPPSSSSSDSVENEKKDRRAKMIEKLSKSLVKPDRTTSRARKLNVGCESNRIGELANFSVRQSQKLLKTLHHLCQKNVVKQSVVDVLSEEICVTQVAQGNPKEFAELNESLMAITAVIKRASSHTSKQALTSFDALKLYGEVLKYYSAVSLLRCRRIHKKEKRVRKHAEVNKALAVGKKVKIRGTSRWAGEVYDATVVDVRPSDHTIKVQYSDGGFKRFRRTSLCPLLIMDAPQPNVEGLTEEGNKKGFIASKTSKSNRIVPVSK